MSEAPSREQWERVGDYVARHMGLNFSAQRQADLARGIAAAAQESHEGDTARFVRDLLSRPPEAEQLQRLARHLTIGETYFFRDTPVFAALQREVLPRLIESRRGHRRRLRFWSAACASGEEPYSLAILLDRLLPVRDGWHITITATDINPAALRKAEAAVYGNWSFRDVAPDIKRREFEQRDDGRHALRPELRRLVNFEYLNLVEDAWPSLATDTVAMDLVFCRNVLMYFRPAEMREVIARLHRALVPGGWLVVSPSEASQTLFRQFEAVNFPGAILYRKAAARNAAAAWPVGTAAPSSTPVQTRDIAPPAPPEGGPKHSPEAASEAPPEAAGKPAAEFASLAAHAARARALADAGDLDAALACCDRWIETAKLDPHAHYLRAVVLLEAGELASADASLRRAVFLDAAFVLAHFALGNLARRLQRAAEAARHYANTRHLLERLEPATLLPEGEGITAGRLMQVLDAMAAMESAA